MLKFTTMASASMKRWESHFKQNSKNIELGVKRGMKGAVNRESVVKNAVLWLEINRLSFFQPPVVQ